MLKVSLAYTRLRRRLTAIYTWVALFYFLVSVHTEPGTYKEQYKTAWAQIPPEYYTHPLFQLGGLGSAVSSRSQWWIQDFWKDVWRVPEGHEGVDEGRGVPSLGWGPRRGCAPSQKIFEI